MCVARVSLLHLSLLSISLPPLCSAVEDEEEHKAEEQNERRPASSSRNPLNFTFSFYLKDYLIILRNIAATATTRTFLKPPRRGGFNAPIRVLVGVV